MKESMLAENAYSSGEKMKYGGNQYIGESLQTEMCHRMVSN